MPTNEKIEELAYLLWEKEGRPEGRDVTHYYEAERILRQMEDAERHPNTEAGGALSNGGPGPSEAPVFSTPSRPTGTGGPIALEEPASKPKSPRTFTSRGGKTKKRRG